MCRAFLFYMLVYEHSVVNISTHILWTLFVRYIPPHGKEEVVYDFFFNKWRHTLLCTVKIPKEVEEDKFLFAIALLDRATG